MRGSQTVSGITRAGNRLGINALAIAALLVLKCWRGRSRQRRHLRELDDRLLRDVGLSRENVAREVEKPFWRG